MRKPFFKSIILSSLIFLAACSEEPRSAPPPPELSVLTISKENLPLSLEYPGRVSGSRVVEIRARVSGLVVARKYEEGQPVKTGQVLFMIEPDNYQAIYDQAAAQVAIQKASIEQAESDYQRIKILVEEGAVSRREFDQATAALSQAQAGLAAAGAAQKAAKLNLDYTVVRAPVDGVASKEVVTVGNMVNGGTGAGGDMLTSVIQADPAYVDFSLTEPEFLRMRSLENSGAVTLSVTVKAGSSCAGVGTVDFTDTFVNPSTGTVRARAIFDNKNHCLVSGQFLSVEVSGLTLPNVISVPKTAVLFSQAGPMVWVLNAENAVQARPLQIQESWQDRWIIAQGLQQGDRMVTEGILKIGPGVVIKPVQKDAPSTSTVKDQAKGS